MEQRRLVIFVVLLVASLSPLKAHSQDNSSVEAQLNTEYQRKLFRLRGFYTGKTIEFDENGKPLGRTSVGSWTLATVRIGTITLLPDSIEIDGERFGSYFKDKQETLLKFEKVTIRIKRPDATTEDSLTATKKLISAVFMEQNENVCPELPDFWQLYCAHNDHAWDDVLARYHPYNSTFRPAGETNSNISHPVPKHTPDPKYSDAARKLRLEGTTVMKVVVDETGQPVAVRVVRPLGMGLDEEAVRAVSQWRFRPGFKDGVAVPVQIGVEVNFRCCP